MPAASSVHDIYQSTHLQDATLDAGSAAGKVIYSTDDGASWQHCMISDIPFLPLPVTRIMQTVCMQVWLITPKMPAVYG